MTNINLILGNPHEGKTREMLEKYYDFCNGVTIIEEDGIEKSFKNYELVKPYFIAIEDEPQVLRNFIKSTANERNETFDLNNFNLIMTSNRDTIFLPKVFSESGDKILFVDFNLSLEELNYFLKDFHYQTQEYKFNIDLYITLVKPRYYLKDKDER